jgi:hypothetical protein
MPDRAAAAVSLAGIEAYVSPMLSERLHHDLEVAERATGAFAFGVIIAAFVAVAVGTAVYDIGKWLAFW